MGLGSRVCGPHLTIWSGFVKLIFIRLLPVFASLCCLQRFLSFRSGEMQATRNCSVGAEMDVPTDLFWDIWVTPQLEEFFVLKLIGGGSCYVCLNHMHICMHTCVITYICMYIGPAIVSTDKRYIQDWLIWDVGSWLSRDTFPQFIEETEP